MMKLLLVIVVMFSFTIGGCGLSPPLRVIHHDGEVTIDVMTLGEYHTAVGRIRLMAMPTSDVLWELTADEMAPQIWGFTLSVGENPVYPKCSAAKRYRVVVPTQATVFFLEREQEYMIEVCDKTCQYCAKEQFTFSE